MMGWLREWYDIVTWAIGVCFLMAGALLGQTILVLVAIGINAVGLGFTMWMREKGILPKRRIRWKRSREKNS